MDVSARDSKQAKVDVTIGAVIVTITYETRDGGKSWMKTGAVLGLGRSVRVRLAISSFLQERTPPVVQRAADVGRLCDERRDPQRRRQGIRDALAADCTG